MSYGNTSAQSYDGTSEVVSPHVLSWCRILFPQHDNPTFLSTNAGAVPLQSKLNRRPGQSHLQRSARWRTRVPKLSMETLHPMRPWPNRIAFERRRFEPGLLYYPTGEAHRSAPVARGRDCAAHLVIITAPLRPSA